jgi:hypothetical protein
MGVDRSGKRINPPAEAVSTGGRVRFQRFLAGLFFFWLAGLFIFWTWGLTNDLPFLLNPVTSPVIRSTTAAKRGRALQLD